MSDDLRAQLEQLGPAERMAVLLWLADFATAETAAAVRAVRTAQADAADRFFCAPSPNPGEPAVWSSQEIPLPPAVASVEITDYVPPGEGPLHPYM
jgi:hypothetical protein